MPVIRATVQLIGLLIAGFLPVSYTYAYGALGHEIVGELATAYLCVQAATEVEYLLDGESLGRASRWPDWIRKDPRWRKSKPWHFINVTDNGRIAAVTGRSGGDVIWAIDKFSAELAEQKLSKSQRAEALRFLAHFIADVHQPLHVGRQGDRGGNRIGIVIDGRKSNLHKFWDAQWLLKFDRSQHGYERDEQIAAIRALGADRVEILQSVGVLEWARESQALRPAVYAFSVTESGEFDEQYRAVALKISRLRLAAAGIRLAGMLNDIFCPQVDRR
ncbi:MAG: S1/P1 nuclease [Gammaproteobacteria bacterium]|nr:S1/P1 nuclease [Gammaproteobacteria bacterium]